MSTHSLAWVAWEFPIHISQWRKVKPGDNARFFRYSPLFPFLDKTAMAPRTIYIVSIHLDKPLPHWALWIPNDNSDLVSQGPLLLASEPLDK